MFLNISHKSYRIMGTNSVIKLQTVLYSDFDAIIWYTLWFICCSSSLIIKYGSYSFWSYKYFAKSNGWELFYIILRYAFNIVQFSKNNENKDRPLISEAYFHYYHHKELHAFSFLPFFFSSTNSLILSLLFMIVRATSSCRLRSL